MENLLPVILALPLTGFLLTVLFGRRLARRASWLPVTLIVATWVVSMVVAFSALTGAAPFGTEGAGLTLWRWIPAGQFTVDVGLYADNLTACLLIVVTTIGML